MKVTHRTRVNIDRSALDETLDSTEVQEEMDRRADNCADFQRRVVPVDTGNLQRHISVKRTDGGDDPIETPNGRGRLIGAFDVEYGAAVENGSDHVSSKGKQYHIAAQPYVKPSIDALRD